ncbi:hypothetical protein [Comamonas sp. NLF-1-9]|uniref:hypothetical protein n=1 Tax=Comamonas sp. NLF-1-9 TaxID=2853163 RepID=UPI001C460302|nr:hypothetical protein [Comamonas sp. NLF-1-9]QXL84086.1 hypothetical protein KUD94_12730 [Comamonas sp. NLF-1-9]
MADGKLTFARTTDSADAGELHLGEWGGAQPTLQNGLLFRNPASGNAKLVFGYTVDPGAADVPDAEFGIDADLDSDAAASITLAVITALGIDATFDDEMPATISLAWDANVSRSLLARVAPAWQEAAPCTPLLRSHWQDAGALSVARAVHWQRAAALAGSARMHWQASLGLQAGTRAAWQLGRGITADLRAAFEEARSLRAGARPHWQRGLVQSIAPRIGFQQMLALTAPARVHWQRATPLLPWWALRNAPALRVPTAWRPHWQEAWLARPGGTPRPPPPQPPGKLVCYDPARLGLLVFRQPAGTERHGTLFFICTKSGGGPGPQPDAPIVVARRRSYIVINSIEVRRVDTDQLLPALDQGLSMQLDRGSWTWGFTVSFHASALPLLQPAPDGTPVALLLTVNGQPFRMVVESIARSVRFPAAHLTVRGRGRAALLDAPYAATRSFGHLLDRTAQQLMEEALTINGVPIGWSLDWQIDDWLIPAATWAHQGTWISAVTDIAAAVGAYVQPHDTDEVLRILPAWPAPIWSLPDATPDIELPPGIATVEETEWITQPDYDALYMHGEPGTSLYYRKRAGTAGDSLAPMAVHPLLVHADAARQRALAELSETGRQVEHTLQTMVLPETGIIKPGTLLRYTDDSAVARVGITRAVSVAMSGPTLTQTIKVQAHA